MQGSTPVMVAIKYGNLEVLKILLKDERVDMGKKDRSGRSLSELIGVANNCCSEETKQNMFETIRAENNKRESMKKKKMSLSKSKSDVRNFHFTLNSCSFRHCSESETVHCQPSPGESQKTC